MLLFWIVVFIASLIILVKGAGYLISSAEKIGLSLGLSPFIIGILIVSLGTSFPELVSSLFAVFSNASEIVVSNAIGSNITNILLVVGISTIINKKLIITKSILKSDIPLLLIGTLIFVTISWDKQISFNESLLLVISYILYVIYNLVYKKKLDKLYQKENLSIIPFKKDRNKHLSLNKEKTKTKITPKNILLLIVGIVYLSFGAKYLVNSLIKLSEILNIATSVIAITAVALGTSLPELIVSIKAALQKKTDLALGNIFGSNVFNTLIVIGIPGLIKNLPIDNQVFTIGLPVMVLSTILFTVSSLFKKIYLWQGIIYLLIYVLFILKLFNLI